MREERGNGCSQNGWVGGGHATGPPQTGDGGKMWRSKWHQLWDLNCVSLEEKQRADEERKERNKGTSKDEGERGRE